MMSKATLIKCFIGSKSTPVQTKASNFLITSRAVVANGHHQSMVLNMSDTLSAVRFNASQSAAAVSAPSSSPLSSANTSASAATDSSSSSSSTDVVLMNRYGDKGVITLNRPKVLNAINFDMAIKLQAGLRSWYSDNQIKMIVMKSASEKAFCAGGDIKKICAMGLEESKRYFRVEYPLNYLVSSSSVPSVALINGICMGGGCGLSVNGKFRVATEKALFAMPETAIGLFPDCGGSHFLNKLPGSLGLYLGLTGHRLRGRDLFKTGLATHFIPSDKLKVLEDDLMRIERPNLQKIDETLQRHHEQWRDESSEEFSLKPHIGRIESIFGQASKVEDIISGLEMDNSEWARKHLELLSKLSPTSLKLSFESLRRAKTMNLAECVKMEYRIVCRILDGKEFAEGVRSVLIDKDDKPRWNPASLDQVREADINAYFEPLPHNLELQL